MAKTVDEFSTLDDFRLKYNELATDVGDIAGLTTDRRTTIIDALNSIEEKVFFFQEYIFTATASQIEFTGQDNSGNTLRFRKNRVQVFVDDMHLLEDDDYIIASPVGNAHTEIQLVGSYSAGLSAGQKLTVYSFTGSFIGTEIQDAIVGYYTENQFNAIYNTNDEGVILNARSFGATTVLTKPDVIDGEYKIELAGNVYTQGNQLTDGNFEIGGTLDVTGTITGNLTGDVTGDIYASNGTSKILESGTNGTDATFTGDVTGQVSDITNHAITALNDVNDTNPTSGQTGYLLTWTGTEWQGAEAPDTGVITLTSSNGIVDNGTASDPDIELDYEIVSVAPTVAGGTSTGHLWFVV